MYTRLETLDHRILVDLLALRLVAQPSPPSVISGTAVLTQLPGQSVTARLKEMKKKKKKEKEREREREKKRRRETRATLLSKSLLSLCLSGVHDFFFSFYLSFVERYLFLPRSWKFPSAGKTDCKNFKKYPTILNYEDHRKR